MALLTDTIARPYAKAIFEVAIKQDQLDRWSKRLDQAAAWVRNPQIAVLLNDPKVTPQALYELFLALFGEVLEASGQQFVRLLIAYKRLSVLPQIALEFNCLLANYQKRMEVRVTSASRLTEKQSEQLLQALRKRLQCDVVLKCAADETLIGGAVIRIGDTVIDGSLRGKLSRLRSELEENRL